MTKGKKKSEIKLNSRPHFIKSSAMSAKSSRSLGIVSATQKIRFTFCAVNAISLRAEKFSFLRVLSPDRKEHPAEPFRSADKNPSKSYRSLRNLVLTRRFILRNTVPLEDAKFAFNDSRLTARARSRK